MAADTRPTIEGINVCRQAIESFAFAGDVMFSIPDHMRLADARPIVSRKDEDTRHDVERREADDSAFRARVAAALREARRARHSHVVACGTSRLSQLCRSGFIGTGTIAKRHSQAEVERVRSLMDL